MNKQVTHLPRSLSLVAAATLAVLAACSSVPAANMQLDDARRDFRAVQANPQAATVAATELSQAADAMGRADAAYNKNAPTEEVNHLAYLAKQRSAIAMETVRQKGAEAAVTSASVDRDRLRLAARTNEADAAQRNADMAKAQADASQRSAAAANMQADAARRDSAEAQARAAALEAQMKDMNAKQTERGMVVTIGDVLFDTNRAELKSGSLRSVEKLVEFLKANPQRSAVVEGFTDSVGSDASNQTLSGRRAESIQMALVNMGVSRERISARGYGEAFPVASNDTLDGRQLNRRVEIVLSDETGKIKPR